jgi:hypothetical protein
VPGLPCANIGCRANAALHNPCEPTWPRQNSTHRARARTRLKRAGYPPGTIGNRKGYAGGVPFSTRLWGWTRSSRPWPLPSLLALPCSMCDGPWSRIGVRRIGPVSAVILERTTRPHSTGIRTMAILSTSGRTTLSRGPAGSAGVAFSLPELASGADSGR